MNICHQYKSVKNNQFYKVLHYITAIILIVVVTNIGGAKQAQARSQTFHDWLKDLKEEVIAEDISENTFDRAINGMDQPIERIIELDRKQPEGTMSFSQYKARVINDARIKQGNRLFKKHHKQLVEVANRYNVQPQYIVALWGIETSYGNNTGSFGVIPALATLAYDGRRSEFFRSELIDALKILQEGHITYDNMKGSWAGAMGQNQFMPSSFHKFAVDGDHDGKRDIWTSLPDVFSSTANYLNNSGWKNDERWGRRVKLMDNFDETQIGLDVSYELGTWLKMGVRLPDGKAIPVIEGMKASLIAPDGIKGPVYLVYDNYRVVMKWNNSIYFATCIGLLADQIIQ
ncbi:MAG: lytic murein transglycosylase [Alphaproteobacteria bacterium]|nr:lytic murein transglycosylase [Alphaproteobacteria bacterium]